MTRRPRAHELGLTIGQLPRGNHNAITDVGGVLVGHVTLVEGQGRLVPGKGPVRTGATAILPHDGNLYLDKVAAGVHTINGYGKACGFEQVRELGTIETPILLTNTLNVGLVWDALVTYSIGRNPGIGITTGTINPIVAEINDGHLNDVQGRHVKEEHVLTAIQGASGGPIDEGCVGGGTGAIAFGFKAGIGTASRITPSEAGGFTLGALVQSNFGRREDLIVNGYPLGREQADHEPSHKEEGSVVIVLATDAPCSSRQLTRIARRAAHGLARSGAYTGHSSGDFALAFSTTNRRSHDPADQHLQKSATLISEDKVISYLFKATVECVEEAVINALLRAETMIGRDGHVAQAIPLEVLKPAIYPSGG